MGIHTHTHRECCTQSTYTFRAFCATASTRCADFCRVLWGKAPTATETCRDSREKAARRIRVSRDSPRARLDDTTNTKVYSRRSKRRARLRRPFRARRRTTTTWTTTWTTWTSTTTLMTTTTTRRPTRAEETHTSPSQHPIPI